MNEVSIEKIAMIANEAGFETRNSPVLMGRSGVEHTFSLLIICGDNRCAVDVYDSPGEGDVLRTYLKKFDTGASSYIVSLTGTPSESTMNLALKYGIGCFGIEEIEGLTNWKKEMLSCLASS